MITWIYVYSSFNDIPKIWIVSNIWEWITGWIKVGLQVLEIIKYPGIGSPLSRSDPHRGIRIWSIPAQGPARAVGEGGGYQLNLSNPVLLNRFITRGSLSNTFSSAVPLLFKLWLNKKNIIHKNLYKGIESLEQNQIFKPQYL